MSKEKENDFLLKLASALDVPRESISIETRLEELDWDSLAAISTIAIVDECYGVTIRGDKLIQCKSIDDVIKLAF